MELANHTEIPPRTKIMPGMSAGAGSPEEIAARIERLPLTRWQTKARLIVGTATFFDAFDALAIAYALPVLIKEFNLSAGQIGMVISIGFLGQLIGALLTGFLAEKFGRLRMTIYTILLFSVTGFFVAASWSLGSLLFFRFIQGIGLGGEVPLAASYINEITKAQRRGKFVLLYELIFSFGLMAVAIASYYLIPTLGWRWIFIIGGIPAILTLFMRRQLPESPRWLAGVGRAKDADQAMTFIEDNVRARTNGVLPEPVIVPLNREQQPGSVRELFKGVYRKRTLVLWSIWFTSYLAFYGVSTWVPSIFKSVFNLSVEQSLLYGLVLILAGVVSAFICALTIDIVGRKAWITSSMLLGAASFITLWLIGAKTPAQVLIWASIGYAWVAVVTMAVYLYTPELYPTRMRALGTSLASAWLRLSSIIGPTYVGFILTNSSISYVFLGFGVVSLAGGIIFGLFGIETKGKSLEELSP
ncbi:MFS transporter [Paenibacillus piri]|uniref:MFS transporter n=1 Tax=Paenibacillus piri TaxID=2547395 RepID=A0A4R5KHM4_9BACL|nr:MFS transporter [Paenibacillus piri]TDF94856.1 MFS transporter [Paenibacillus piri]